MLEKDIPYCPLTMYRTETKDYPRYALPEGFEFVFYREGDAQRWAEIETAVGQFDTVKEGLACFDKEFRVGQNLSLSERMIFVKDARGDYVATCSLWNGDFCGKERQRFHWLAVKDECAGRGIAKALLTRMMDLYNELGYHGFVYLLTGTPNYRAVRIYRNFGFAEYVGPTPSGDLSNEEFAKQTQKAIAFINERLAR